MYFNNWQVGDICTVESGKNGGHNFYTIVGIEEEEGMAKLKKLTFNLFTDNEIRNMHFQSLGRPYGTELLLLALLKNRPQPVRVEEY